MKKILFAGGGSLGHIAPSIAVWNTFKQNDNEAEAHFVCSTSKLDTNFLKSESIPYSTIDAPRIGISFIWKFWKAVSESKKIIKREKINIVFSKGGHVSIPVCFAAKKMKIPIVLHESDAVLGRANKIIAKWADVLCMGMQTKCDSCKNIKVTGNPIRETITKGSKEKGFQLTGLKEGVPILMVIGGSQGSEALNEAINMNIDSVITKCQIIHITGAGKSGSNNRDGYFCIEFAHEQLPHLYAITDLALTRAGANLISELSANKIKTILVPLRGVGHDHQQKNAEAIESNAHFTVLQQKDLSEKLLQK
ncbi:hypothetical protein HN682_00705, partial [Candidatus Peregrinibacteria bacterium]|nr:hypothetical protein [Candidatus Peregrinibacteria bacterium]